MTREELDTTTIGGTLAQNAPFRTFITGFADGSGSATVYFTDDDTTIANRLIEDVIQRKQLAPPSSFTPIWCCLLVRLMTRLAPRSRFLL